MELVTFHSLSGSLVVLIHSLGVVSNSESAQLWLLRLMVPKWHAWMKRVVHFKVIQFPLELLYNLQVVVLALHLHVGELIEEMVRPTIQGAGLLCCS